jgi:hypothetical protein
MAKKPTSVTYLVALDAASGRWNVSRNDVPTGGFAREKGTAIGLAYGQASLEQAGTDLDVRVFSIQGKKRTQEWPTVKKGAKGSK